MAPAAATSSPTVPRRGTRLRSRTATVSFGDSTPAAMREVGGGALSLPLPIPAEEYADHLAHLDAPRTIIGRKSSKSVSGMRPPLSTSASSHSTYSQTAGPSTPSGSTRSRNGLKRRISTPNLNHHSRHVADDDVVRPETDMGPAPPPSSSGLTPPTAKVYETRARSTSTSIVVPQTFLLTEQESPTLPVKTIVPAPGDRSHPTLTNLPVPPPWSNGMYVTPPSPPMTVPREPSPPPDGVLHAAYNMGESIFKGALAWVTPKSHRRSRRSSRPSSDEDSSEKGLDGSEEEETFDGDDDDGQTRVGLGHSNGRYWGLFADEYNADSPTYFALPPTPPDDRADVSLSQSLPTPAMSNRSLSNGREQRHRRASRAASLREPGDGWWVKVYRAVVGGGSGKTAEVLRELGWTVALLAGLFVVSFLLVLYAIQSMPITHLKSMPKSTTDLQLLSADIRQYMASGSSGWWHTVGVLTYVGCWKHAWSVPGAVVLNILVGSVFDPIAALVLLTLITAFGSLGAYSLSRPLAPLIAVLFPKPLALVRAALAPESVSRPAQVTPMETISTSSAPTLRIATDEASLRPQPKAPRPNVWRRLLLMRAMGFVPWSGMNVACGVVGVDWCTFWLTTAAGSASWSYVTASVGNILSRLAVPSGATASVEGAPTGESLTSLLRDPALIAKLVFLSLLTLVPVLLKRRAAPSEDTDTDTASTTPTTPSTPSALGLDTTGSYSPGPASPLAASLANFTPTPHMFDLLSFGRSATRQAVRFVTGSARTAVGTARRLVQNLSS